MQIKTFFQALALVLREPDSGRLEKCYALCLCHRAGAGTIRGNGNLDAACAYAFEVEVAQHKPLSQGYVKKSVSDRDK